MAYHFDRISYVDGVSKRKSKVFRKGRRYRKDEPYICSDCNKVWQPLRTYRDRSDYLVGFPKMGCTVKICFSCKEKKGKKNGTNEENSRVS